MENMPSSMERCVPKNHCFTSSPPATKTLQPAIAAAISLRSYLLVSALSKSHRTVTMRFPDIQLEHTWNIDDLPWDAFSAPGKKKYYYDLVTSLDPDLLAVMQPHIDAV